MDTSMVTLSPRSWHARLQKFVFRVEPGTIKNLCPYFWLTIAALILFLPSLVSVFPYWILRGRCYKRFLRRLTKGQVWSLVNDFPYRVNDDVIHEMIQRTIYCDYPDEKIIQDYIKETGLDPEEIDSWRPEFDKEIERLENFLERKKRTLGIIMKWTKWLLGILLVIAGCLASAILIDAILYLYHMNVPIIKVMLMILGFLGFIFLIPFSVELSFTHWENRKTLRWGQIIRLIPLWVITSPFLVCGRIKKMSGLFGEYLKATYKDYCPGIKWERND